MAESRKLEVYRLGRIDYSTAHDLQKRLVQARIQNLIPDTLLLLEHNPVITLGRSARPEHLLHDRDVLQAQGIQVFDIGRGGDVTYHGPGQLVAYPIIDLKPNQRDVRKYVWCLEEVIIRIAASFGLNAVRIQGLNGGWIGDRKIGAIGVRITKWVTMHGFSFNVTTDLNAFETIVPCGIPNKEVTSLERELGRAVDMDTIIRMAAEQTATVLSRHLIWCEGQPAGIDTL